MSAEDLAYEQAEVAWKAKPVTKRSLRVSNNVGIVVGANAAQEARRPPFLTLRMRPKLFRELKSPYKEFKHRNPHTNKPAEFKLGVSKLFLWPKPTPYDIRAVTSILRPEDSGASSVVAATDPANNPFHGGHDFTVDSIVRVILAATSTNEQALTAQQAMIVAYPYWVNGVSVEGKKPNYHAMRAQGWSKLQRVLRSAGLVKKRPVFIKKALDMIYTVNTKDLPPLEPGIIEFEGNEPNAPDFVPGTLSVDYIWDIYKHGGKQVLLDYFMTFEGIATKSAFCLMSFNMGIPVFAVDTHVLGMARLLG